MTSITPQLESNPLIVALDLETPEQALAMVDRVGDGTGFFKVGMELYAAAGMSFVRTLLDRGLKVFLDLKLYDIDETVKRATRQIAKSGVHFLTVHGNRSIMRAAVEGRGDSSTELLAVTVLTSLDRDDLAELGYPTPAAELVALRVRNGLESGIDGIVCAPLEVADVRKIAGNKLKLVTPGVRSAGAATGDQKRVATPAQAIQNGADYLVVGRQVTRADDPRAACEQILRELAGVSRANTV